MSDYFNEKDDKILFEAIKEVLVAALPYKDEYKTEEDWLYIVAAMLIKVMKQNYETEESRRQG